MKTFRSALLFLAVVVAVLCVAACGNKGDLVKPTPSTDTPPPAAPASQSPQDSAQHG